MPQLRDTVDDIILNRDMDHPSQVVNEQAFMRMQEGAAGQVLHLHMHARGTRSHTHTRHALTHTHAHIYTYT